MFVGAVIQTVVVGVEENPEKMSVMLAVLVITKQTRTANGEDHRILSETVDLVPAEAVVLEGKNHSIFKLLKKLFLFKIERLQFPLIRRFAFYLNFQ